MPRRKPWLVLILILGVAPLGCFRAYNPTYFPHWGYGGDIIRTHAKPAGRAYFKNFDPFACRIDLTPGRVTNPVNAQQVLIATVVDKDGKPRRSRRVEWILDGPGHIVEVDESGLFAGRGYKVDNTYAVSYTDYKEHTITRGNDDPRDDFTIYPGQTWCVVSCAIPGETVVTAYAPEVHDWRNGRITTRITWTDTQFDFPPPVISRLGGSAVLSTTVRRAGRNEPASGMKVRYRIVEGTPAALTSRSGAGTTAVLSGAGLTEAEVLAGTDGTAAVTVVQPTPQPGTTRVVIEVLKPDTDGTPRVIGRRETTVEWAAADLTLDVVPPRVAAVGQDASVRLVIANTGKVESSAVTVRLELPDGVEFVRATPSQVVQEGRVITWNLPAIAGERQETVELVVRSAKRGNYPFTVVAQSVDGRSARRDSALQVDQAGVKLAVTVPDTVPLGGRVPARVTVTNTGAVPLDSATVWVSVDAGLAGTAGTNPIELAVGRIPAGEAKTVELPLAASRPGESRLRANVVADGGLSDRVESVVAVRKADMKVTISGPERLIVGAAATWEITVMNTGETPLQNLSVQASLSPALTLKATTAATGSRLADQEHWTIDSLAPGERKVLKLQAVAEQMTPRATVTVQAQAGDHRTGPRATTQATVTVSGQPALVLALADPSSQVPVGRRGGVRITVSNRGNGPAENVEVALTVTPELKLHGGRGPNGEVARVEGDSIRFPAVAQIPPGTSQGFIVEVEAVQTGSARIRVEARADHLLQPLRDEQPLQITRGN